MGTAHDKDGRWFAHVDEGGLADFWRVYDARFNEVSEAIIARLPSFGHGGAVVAQSRRAAARAMMQELIAQGANGDTRSTSAPWRTPMCPRTSRSRSGTARSLR